MTVLSTTRNPHKAGALIGIGVDHVLIDDGQIVRHVHDILLGLTLHLNSLRRQHFPTHCAPPACTGVVCSTGMLSN